MNSNFNCSYMAMSSLTYILGFSVSFFQPDYSVWEYYEIKITSKSFAQKFELKWSLGGPLSKLCVPPPFSINFRCQIENQVSDYRLLGASMSKTLYYYFLYIIWLSVLSNINQPWTEVRSSTKGLSFSESAINNTSYSMEWLSVDNIYR
jgi:hypothetical protein